MLTNKPTIGIFGNFQNGKSTFINCILQDALAKVGGRGMSVTDVKTHYKYGPKFVVKAMKDGAVVQKMENVEKYKYFTPSGHIDEIVVQVKNNALKEYNLLDTPGLDANEQDTALALNAVDDCDFALLVLRNRGVSQTEKSLARSLYAKHVPFVVLINCYNSVDIENSWLPTSKHNKTIADNIIADLKASGITPFLSKGYPQALKVNLAWRWIALDIAEDDESVGIKSAKRLLKGLWVEYFGNQGYSLKTLATNSQFDAILALLNDKKYRSLWFLWNDLNKCNTEICTFIETMKSTANIFHDQFLWEQPSEVIHEPFDHEDEKRVVPNNPLLDIRNFELF